MALRRADEYRESLRDGRRIVYRGELVDDVNTHPSLALTIDHAAGLFDHPNEGPDNFWSYEDEALGNEVSAYFRRPLSRADLRARGDVIEESLIELIRDISASEFGGYNYVFTLHGEGSMGAQLVQTVRDYDVAECVARVDEILTRARA